MCEWSGIKDQKPRVRHQGSVATCQASRISSHVSGIRDQKPRI
ncbi:MAG: hypothetical protein ACTSYS_05095 [Promethearchaeota archaeon]